VVALEIHLLYIPPFGRAAKGTVASFVSPVAPVGEVLLKPQQKSADTQEPEVDLVQERVFACRIPDRPSRIQTTAQEGAFAIRPYIADHQRTSRPHPIHSLSTYHHAATNWTRRTESPPGDSNSISTQ